MSLRGNRDDADFYSNSAPPHLLWGHVQAQQAVFCYLDHAKFLAILIQNNCILPYYQPVSIMDHSMATFLLCEEQAEENETSVTLRILFFITLKIFTLEENWGRAGHEYPYIRMRKDLCHKCEYE